MNSSRLNSRLPTFDDVAFFFFCMGLFFVMLCLVAVAGVGLYDASVIDGLFVKISQ